MSGRFERFLSRLHPPGTELGETAGLQLQQEKLLLTVATQRGTTLAAPLLPLLAQERRKLERLRALGTALVQTHAGVRLLKGERHGALYPTGHDRYQGDLDLLAGDEASFASCLADLTRRGMTMRTGHVTAAPQGESFYASAIFYEPNADGDRTPDSLVVELHLRAFPITPFSHLDRDAAPIAMLGEDAFDALVLLGEFVYRDGRAKRFLQRDLLDSLLVFDKLSPNDLPAFTGALDDSALWVSLALLRHQLQRIDWYDLPASLDALFNDPRCLDQPADYSMYEHQTWPFWQRRGRTRAQYEAMVSAYGLINPRQDPSEPLSAFEIGLHCARGVPIAFRLREDVLSALDGDCRHVRLLNVCQLVAGPPDRRRVIHPGPGV
ncbi:hypothetical protein [Roseateles depolymerans]|uniref:Uncharacterized protein n=1 Tax=Roseateles depolymerans TaxID=76731 RepID=A0A0U3MQJ0_9BURK|nr:hypothetical protein [Roseateles depolymerans]ALV05187.1 hypothetical protein RD2015_691 [Roseateles depolymerans]REG14797.1 hypothetical protein DES44_3294 [Roseateles depolymerans]